jgi:hypothetical protein
MAQTEYIQQLAKTISAQHGSRAEHIGSTFIAELCSGRMAWQGQVETFRLLDHPTAKRCYAWKEDGDRALQTMLAGASVTSPQTALRTALSVKNHRRELVMS